MNVLVTNCGSSSVKFQVIDSERSVSLAAGKVERVDRPEDYGRALNEVAAAVAEYRLDAVGHRVVHGGEKFATARLIDDRVVAAIENCVPLAPLHNPANLAGIRARIRRHTYRA